jgi:hypothetical protein
MKKYIILIVLTLSLINVYSQSKSYKRGVAYGHHSVADIEEFSKYISWWYNWAPQPEADIRNIYQYYDVDFVPMAWNNVAISGVKTWADKDILGKYLLGFNEPNFIEQANMTPSESAAAWPDLQKIAEDNNLEIVSPAVNYCGNCVSENGTTYNNPFTYLDDFFAECADCQVDFIGLHWYGSGNSIVGYINNGRKYNKPIWVTEFASIDYSNPVKNIEDQKKYLAGTVNFLERDPDVYRYSWFIGRSDGGIDAFPYIDLYGEDGMLTELGQLYADIPVYDPEMRIDIPGRIECEEYYLMSGLFAEPTEDSDGFLNMGWTDVGDWAEYKISVKKSGTYRLDARIAGSNGGILNFSIDDNSVGNLTTPTTGGWQNWETVSMDIDLEEGDHILKMYVRNDGFNINWIEISDVTGTTDYKIIDAQVYPNPVSSGIVTISLSGVNAGEDYNYGLFDINGRTILTGVVKPNRFSFQIDLNRKGNIDSGIYYLKLASENNQVMKKLVIR